MCKFFISLICLSIAFCPSYASSSKSTSTKNLNSTKLKKTENSLLQKATVENSDSLPSLDDFEAENVKSTSLDLKTDIEVPSEEKNHKYQEQLQEQKSESSVKTGFHSAFGLGLNRTTLRGTFNDSAVATKKEGINLKNNHLGANFSIGYDKNINLLVLGAGVTTTLNFGSTIEYKKDTDIIVADVKPGAEYLAFAKLGIALGRVMLYGKFGGGLSHAKYEWKIGNAPNTKSSYDGQLAYGGGIECLFTNNVFVNAEFIANSKKSLSLLNVSNKKGEIKNSNIQSYQISMGCGYRF